MSTYWDQLFATIPQEAASRLYCIAFTPRSGSTWLGDLLSNSGILGMPDEWFNPHPKRKTAENSGATDLLGYYSYLKRVMRTGDVFGLEISWPQLDIVLQSRMTTQFEDIPWWFFLRRKDFVAQAVSLYKAELTGHFHSVQDVTGDEPPEYSPRRIAKNIQRIMAHEFALNLFFRSRKIVPVELWHEELLTLRADEVLKLFSNLLESPSEDIARVDMASLKSQHQKIGDANNDMMMSRFKSDYPEITRYWEIHRGERSVKSFMKECPAYPVLD